MILASRDLAPGTTLDADICIIGAGAAGITLACECDRPGLSVVLLEAGGLKFDPVVQADYQGQTDDAQTHPRLDLFRRRVFGGSTTIWGGRCVPLDPIDFERRAFVPHSGWPISWDSLARHYPRAQDYLEIGAYDYTAAGAIGPGAPPTIDGFTSAHIVGDRVERFSPPTDFGKRRRRQMERSSDLRVLLNAPCVGLEGDEQGVEIRRAVAARGGASRVYVRARVFVLAVGGLETVRLLAVSDSSRRGGLGNASGALGRYYMCHLENTLGELALTPKTRPAVIDFETSPEGVYVRRKFALSSEAQIDNELLNSTFRLHYPTISDPSHGHPVLSAMFLVKDAVLPEYRRKLATFEAAQRDRMTRGAAFYARHLSNIVLNTPETLRFSLKWTRKRILAARKLPFVALANPEGRYPLDFNSEQVPNPESQVSIVGERDANGLPRLKVAWRATAQDFESIVKTYALMQRAFAASGAARLEFQPEHIADLAKDSTPVGGHHIGTARMSASERDGVVDPDCRVHGTSNLFVASSAVFPTCGHANPTLTIVALAIRLADHLNSALRAPVAAEAPRAQSLCDATR